MDWSGLVVAHPLTEPGDLGISPAAVSAAVAVALAGAWRMPWPRTGGGRGLLSAGSGVVPAAAGRWAPPEVRRLGWARLGALALLLVAVAAGRVGADDELRNVAGVAVVGIAWPLLAALALAGRDLLAAADPWDALARLTRMPDPEPGAVDVRAAVPGVVAFTAYLALWPSPLAPRALGAALASWTIVTLAGCAAFGRRRWLQRCESIGVLLRLCAQRGALSAPAAGGSPAPVRGAAVLLGVAAGGLLSGVLRTSRLGAGIAAGPGTAWWRAAVFGGCVVVGALLLDGLRRRARRWGAERIVAGAAAPVVAAVAVALALGRNRVTTSLQLLVSLVSDPLGRGWDLFGTAAPRPLWVPFATTADSQGLRWLAVVQVLVVTVGGLAGIAVARRAAPDRRRQGPAVAAAIATAAAGALVLAAR